MARRKHRSIAPAKSDDDQTRPIPPTAETVAKVRSDVINRLYDEGRLRPEHVDAALEIRRVWEAFGRGLFPGSQIDDRVPQPHMKAMFLDPIDRLTPAEEIAWRQRYRPWAREMALLIVTGTVRVSRLQLMLDVVVDNNGIRQVEGWYRMRHGGAFPASAHEDALDKLTMLLQQHSEELTRTLASPVSDSTFGELPLKSDLANNVLAFDANGDPIPGQLAAGTSSVSSFITTLLDDVNAATARATLETVIGTDVLAPDGDGSSLTGLFGSTDDGSNLSGIHIQGKQTIWIPAAAILSRTTSGADTGSVETSTNKIVLKTLDFDSAADEYAQFAVKMPKGWDASTVTAQFVWSHAAASSYGVRFFVQAVSLADGDAADTAFGTAVGHTADTGGTTNDIYITPETAAVTIGNTPTKSEWVVFQIYRDVSDAGDTLDVDARLLGVHIHYTTDAGDDA